MCAIIISNFYFTYKNTHIARVIIENLIMSSPASSSDSLQHRCGILWAGIPLGVRNFLSQRLLIKPWYWWTQSTSSPLEIQKLFLVIFYWKANIITEENTFKYVVCKISSISTRTPGCVNKAVAGLPRCVMWAHCGHRLNGVDCFTVIVCL